VFSEVSLKKTKTRGAVSPFIQQLAEQFVKTFQIDVLLNSELFLRYICFLFLLQSSVAN